MNCVVGQKWRWGCLSTVPLYPLYPVLSNYLCQLADTGKAPRRAIESEKKKAQSCNTGTTRNASRRKIPAPIDDTSDSDVACKDSVMKVEDYILQNRHLPYHHINQAGERKKRGNKKQIGWKNMHVFIIGIQNPSFSLSSLDQDLARIKKNRVEVIQRRTECKSPSLLLSSLYIVYHLCSISGPYSCFTPSGPASLAFLLRFCS